MYLHSVEGATNYYPMDVVSPEGSLITCSEGVHRSRVELGLDRLVAFAMSYSSDEGSLTVCSSHSSENYWNMVEPRFQPCVAEDISPRPISVSGAAFPCQLLAYSNSLRIPSLLAELRRYHFA